MKYHISIHISPYEIDNYQTFIHQLRRNLNHVEDKIIFTPMLNLSDYFYDWNNSTLDKTFFIDKFIKINNIVENKCDLKPHVNEDNKILGAFSYKTSFIKRFKNAVDAFIWFDSDMIFPDNTIVSLIEAHKAVNEKYMTIPASHDNYFGFDGYELYKSTDKDLSVIKNEQRFKFASGWCNLLSSDLFKDYIDFTYDLGHYGPDDTFIMNVLDHYKFNKNKDINQYIIKKLVVTENYKYSLNQYKSYIKLNPSILTKEEFSDGVNRAVSKRLNKIINE